jgi:nucleoside-diphosphate-sugar epimerase
VSRYNISSGIEKNLERLVNELGHQMGVEFKVSSRADLTRPDEASSIVVDSSLFQNEFGWRPEHSKNEHDFIRAFLEPQFPNI